MKKRLIALLMIIVLCATLFPQTLVSAAKDNKTYVVEKGDNLYEIGKNHNLSWREIAKLNGIEAPYTIYVGQKLELPLTKEEKMALEEAKIEAKLAEEKANKEAAEAEKKEKAKSDDIKQENASDNNEAESKNDDTSTEETTETGNVNGFSEWAINDLLAGDSYGIYPLTWYEAGLTGAISKEQIKVLTTGLSDKINLADGVTPGSELSFDVKKNMSVEEVLNLFYNVLSSKSYVKDLGLNKKYTPAAYMNEYGIYTGKGGEQGLDEICSVEQACVIASRIVTYVYDTLDAASKGFLWEVNSGNNKVYLLGSIHVANNDIYPFSETMLEAYESSDALVVEVNMYDTTGAAEFSALAMYTDGTTLKDHISAESYTKTVELAAQLGFPEAVIARMKPWYIANLFTSLTTSQSGDLSETAQAAALGIDMSFMSKALLNGKPILEIEGFVKQGKIFDDFSAGLQQYLLDTSIDSLNSLYTGNAKEDKKESNLIDNWLTYWHDGNIDAFKESYNVEDEVYGDTFETDVQAETKAYMEEYYNALLTERDKGMADYIDSLLKAEGGYTYFVVVGSLHYLSDYSVLDLLEEKGYEISQIK
jgi:hypothetical protein